MLLKSGWLLKNGDLQMWCRWQKGKIDLINILPQKKMKGREVN